MDDDLNHPVWCSPRRCTAGSTPVLGHAAGEHRSVPEGVGLTELYLTQTSAGGMPMVEVQRLGRWVVLPPTEAAHVGDAVVELFRRAQT